MFITVVSETLASGQSYKLAGEVGRLTRNIKIVGAAYAQQQAEAFGARVIASITKIGSNAYAGKCGSLDVFVFVFFLLLDWGLTSL